MICVLNFGDIFGVVLVKNATRNQVKKRVGKKLKKQWSPEALSSSGRDQVETFGTQTPCWGVGGYNQKQHARYLTRPWAEGPANNNNNNNNNDNNNNHNNNNDNTNNKNK